LVSKLNTYIVEEEEEEEGGGLKRGRGRKLTMNE
jgi:hypothetical protein